jgi:hypothetical protein
VKDSPLGKLIKHPVDAADTEIKTAQLRQVFGDILSLSSPDLALSLAPFCTVRPLSYFDRNAFQTYLNFLESNIGAALDAVETHSDTTSQAISAIFRQSEFWKIESQQKLSKPIDFLRFDRLWHPEYQRYSEHAYNHLIRIPLEILQKAHGKNYQALELSPRTDKLRHYNLEALTTGFDACLRNAISHGGVHYNEYEIRYVTRNDEKTLWPNSFLKQFDQLIDTCSAHIVALLVFLCRNYDNVSARGIERLPNGLRYLMLRGLCQHPGFDIEAILPFGNGSTNGLNVFCLSETRSRQVHLYEALHAAMQLYRLGVRSGTISFNIDCGATFPASLIINGDHLTASLTDGAPAEEIKNLIQADLLWHNTNTLGRWRYIASTFAGSVFKKAKIAYFQDRRDRGFPSWASRYLVRHIENISAGNLRRLVAEVVILHDSDFNIECIRSILLHASKKLRKHRIQGKDHGRMLFLRRRPSYVTVRIHRSDARIRDLQQRAKIDSGLVAIGEWISVFRRHLPIWVKQPHEIVENVRIRWSDPN